MTIDAATGQIEWTADETHDGTHEAVITVSDDRGAVAESSETLTIVVAEVNEAPTLAPFSAQTAQAGEAFSFTATASDSDLPAQTLTFSLGQAAADLGMAIDPNTGELTWTPAAAHVGEQTAAITVTDDGSLTLSDTQTLTVSVEPMTYSISGELLDPAGAAVDQATVTLLRSTAEGPTEQVEQLTVSGQPTFTFSGLEEGQYALYAEPDLTAFPDLLPTYYASALILAEANLISIDGQNVDGLQVELAEMVEPQGEGALSGIVVQGAGSGGRISQGTEDGAPVAGVALYLAQASTEAIYGQTVSEADGTFRFTGLPEGSYRLLADFEGVPMSLESDLVVIDAANASPTFTVSISEDEILARIAQPTALEQEGALASLAIGPNPVSDRLTWRLSSDVQGQGTITVYDSQGRTCLRRPIDKAIHDWQGSVSLEKLTPGLYVLHLQIGSGKATRKFIKE